MAISECMCYGIGGTCHCVRQNCNDVVKGLHGFIHDNSNPEIYVGF